MKNAPSRRALVAGLAVAGVEVAPFLRPAKADNAPALVGPIEVAYGDYVLTIKVSEATAEALDEAEQRFEEVERPGWHPMQDEGGYTIVPTAPGRCRLYASISEQNLAELRAIVTVPADPELQYDSEPRRQRAKATLEKIDKWRAETQRRADAAGLTVAREAHNRAAALEKAAAHRVFDLEPTNIREVAFQAAILRVDWFADRVDEVLDRLVRLARVKDDYPS